MARSVRTFAVAAVLALCALGTAATASAEAASPAHASSEAGSSSLNKKQKKAKRRALKRCRSKRVVKARKRCHRRVVRRFAKLARPATPPATTPAATVNLVDDFFVPDAVTIERGESILWVWDDANHDPHNVTMTSGPEGVDRHDFETSLSPAVMFSFKRKFTVPGTYTFVCSLHFGMKLTVVVK